MILARTTMKGTGVQWGIRAFLEKERYFSSHPLPVESLDIVYPVDIQHERSIEKDVYSCLL